MVTLNQAQEQAVDMARWSAANPGTITVLSGPAGCGKSTSLKEICRTLPGSVVLAPTGRASLRVKELTGYTASTIHRWLYIPDVDSKTGELKGFQRRNPDELESPASNLLIIDEASMVQREVWDDVCRAAQHLGLSILLVGDSHQLPPVQPETSDPFSVFFAGFHKDRRVDLTEVFRQALDSPILRAATNIRQATGWSQVLDEVEGFLVESPRPIIDAAAKVVESGADTFGVCYTNQVRHDVNRKVRMAKQIDPDGDPFSGEPLLVRRNNYQLGVFNGEILDFDGFHGPTFSMLKTQLGLTEVNRIKCAIHPPELLGAAAAPYQVQKVVLKLKGLPYLSANLGYCLTCHSFQGGEAENVVMLFERKMLKTMNLQERMRWIYTAFSRAKSNLSVFPVDN